MLIDFLEIAAVCVFIVDVSGFTDSWRGALARWLGVKELRPLPPFDCSLCATWWSCLLWALCSGRFSLEAVLGSAFAAFLTPALLSVYNVVRSALLAVLDYIERQTDKIYKL